MKIRTLEPEDIKQVIDIWTNSFSRNFSKPVNPNILVIQTQQQLLSLLRI